MVRQTNVIYKQNILNYYNKRQKTENVFILTVLIKSSKVTSKIKKQQTRSEIKALIIKINNSSKKKWHIFQEINVMSKKNNKISSRKENFCCKELKYT